MVIPTPPSKSLFGGRVRFRTSDLQQERWESHSFDTTSRHSRGGMSIYDLPRWAANMALFVAPPTAVGGTPVPVAGTPQLWLPLIPSGNAPVFAATSTNWYPGFQLGVLQLSRRRPRGTNTMTGNHQSTSRARRLVAVPGISFRSTKFKLKGTPMGISSTATAIMAI